MSKKLILHIGTPKTGTSSIQSFLKLNQKQLQRHGFCFPEITAKWDKIKRGRNGRFLIRAVCNELGIKPDLNDADRVGSAKKEFLEQTKKFSGTVILSDETYWRFFGKHEGSVETFKKITDGFGFDDYEIVAYIRRQDLFVESYRKQGVKRKIGDSRTFEELLQTDLYTLATDYNGIISKIEKVFGQESINLRIYDRKLLKNGDSVSDFLDLLGLDINDGFEIPTEESNDSIRSNAFIELKRLAAESPAYVKGNEDFLRPAIARFSETRGDATPGSFFSSQQRAEYLAQFEEGNRALAQRYFNRDELFGPNSVDKLSKWEPVTGELASDAYLVLVEAISKERAERKEAQIAQTKQIEELMLEVDRLKRTAVKLKRRSNRLI